MVSNWCHTSYIHIHSISIACIDFLMFWFGSFADFFSYWQWYIIMSPLHIIKPTTLNSYGCFPAISSFSAIQISTPKLKDLFSAWHEPVALTHGLQCVELMRVAGCVFGCFHGDPNGRRQHLALPPWADMLFVCSTYWSLSIHSVMYSGQKVKCHYGGESCFIYMWERGMHISSGSPRAGFRPL